MRVRHYERNIIRILKESRPYIVLLKVRDIGDIGYFRRCHLPGKVEHPFKGCQFSFDSSVFSPIFLPLKDIGPYPVGSNVNGPYPLKEGFKVPNAPFRLSFLPLI